ncbi:outer membrane protein assembly factor BamC [Psychromonas sp. CD1]|uniref:outer membrane protein assembly factor BamC n=1 Tax=Psychromonas sp. CD1 TaxID=1979839 RepID=UPI000B9A64B5|nr:outer membrane protein assembly factor BamC [Psychromonas sp. CD1]
MSQQFKRKEISLCIAIVISLTGCARFDTRMQANGPFDYQQSTLNPEYVSNGYSREESRDAFDIPLLNQTQKEIGLKAKNVDIRPPTQLIKIIDGVREDKGNISGTTIIFNTFLQENDLNLKIRTLVSDYLASKNAQFRVNATQRGLVELAEVTEEIIFGNFLNENVIMKKSSLEIKVSTLQDQHQVSLSVRLLKHSETNDGTLLPFKLTNKNKQNIETSFINDLLLFAYQEKEKKTSISLESQPLPIKLGFDENHQMAWLIDESFTKTWQELPSLFKLLNFEIINEDKELGSMLLSYSAPSNDYWKTNNLQPFKLDSAQYFIQLGELTKSSSAIIWLDADKAPLSDALVSEIYLSITDKVRQVLLLKEVQSNHL